MVAQHAATSAGIVLTTASGDVYFIPEEQWQGYRLTASAAGEVTAMAMGRSDTRGYGAEMRMAMPPVFEGLRGLRMVVPAGLVQYREAAANTATPIQLP